MLKSILHVLATAGALLLIAYYIPGIEVANFKTALLVAFLWGIIGLTLRPILQILTLPINILTLGLFSFVLNALLFWLLGMLIPGFEVGGFIPALEGSVLLSLLSAILHAAL